MNKDMNKDIDDMKDMNMDDMNIKKYIASLNEMEMKALKIAEEHLETSFNIVKSIGYQKWIKK